MSLETESTSSWLLQFAGPSLPSSESKLSQTPGQGRSGRSSGTASAAAPGSDPDLLEAARFACFSPAKTDSTGQPRPQVASRTPSSTKVPEHQDPTSQVHPKHEAASSMSSLWSSLGSLRSNKARETASM
eukprot:CAMPEP_0206530568 /NCGR_PEP_ID=MMETSP0325_2-20121206/3252_1 /ASSEMBLY_ACC=CAM_ASM_000347 /TAXON_ID=2866 /ORGANISM="Crypthecodinium cohnii, Strain Seligo" /LENGTH=129 /DNA_ID=CAMNT_0054026655 /DNA_START=36 /DNA_END=424 /DNA_ORIENTATION=+